MVKEVNYLKVNGKEDRNYYYEVSVDPHIKFSVVVGISTRLVMSSMRFRLGNINLYLFENSDPPLGGLKIASKILYKEKIFLNSVKQIDY